jgi:hypothetical protein
MDVEMGDDTFETQLKQLVDCIKAQGDAIENNAWLKDVIQSLSEHPSKCSPSFFLLPF